MPTEMLLDKRGKLEEKPNFPNIWAREKAWPTQLPQGSIAQPTQQSEEAPRPAEFTHSCTSVAEQLLTSLTYAQFLCLCTRIFHFKTFSGQSLKLDISKFHETVKLSVKQCHFAKQELLHLLRYYHVCFPYNKWFQGLKLN